MLPKIVSERLYFVPTKFRLTRELHVCEHPRVARKPTVVLNGDVSDSDRTHCTYLIHVCVFVFVRAY
jgi:hypothetical protein